MSEYEERQTPHHSYGSDESFGKVYMRRSPESSYRIVEMSAQTHPERIADKGSRNREVYTDEGYTDHEAYYSDGRRPRSEKSKSSYEELHRIESKERLSREFHDIRQVQVVQGDCNTEALCIDNTRDQKDREKQLSRNNSHHETYSSDADHSDYSEERRRHRRRLDDNHRGRDDDKHRDRKSGHHHHHSRARDRRSDGQQRSRSRSRSRSRPRRSRHSHRRRRRSDERSSHSDDSCESERYKRQEPNTTIMVRGLASHITEDDIVRDIIACGVMSKEVRVIRHRETGLSRGFAFVEFDSISDASTWMDTRKGVLMLHENYTANLIYTTNSSSFNERSSRPSLADWYCVNCQGHNFKRRDFCYKCRASRPDDETSDAGNEASSHPSCTIILGNLDGLTQEEGVLQAFEQRPGLASIPIRSVRIGRDKITNLSLGLCYVDFNNLFDAIRLYSALKEFPFQIDDREVSVAYRKPVGQGVTDVTVAQHAVEAGQWAVDKEMVKEPYSQEMIQKLANSSAAHYAKTPEEHAKYLQYYLEYYSKHPYNEDTTASPSSSYAQHRNQSSNEMKGKDLVPGSDYAESKYWKSTEVGNESRVNNIVQRGSSTHTKQYNPEYAISKQEGCQDLDAFVTSSTATRKTNPTRSTNPGTQTLNSSEQPASEAKKIKKEMERWEKSLKQEREMKRTTLESPVSVLDAVPSSDPRRTEPEVQAKIVSESSDSDEDSQEYIDKSKLACLLCKRQFSTSTQLQRHVELSDLHKQNLKAKGSGDSHSQGHGSSSFYRDRAQERRKQFGLDKIESKSKIKDLYLQSKKDKEGLVHNPNEGITEDNIGSKLLQKMGWNAGQGLGLRNQGRTDIIVAERRAANAGLGLNTTADADDEGNKYLNPRKVTIARYRQLE